MKIVAFGDSHGFNFWKEVVSKEKFDKFVFIGDYFDSFDFPVETQLQNFIDIMEFKRSRPNDVILLIGNHDFHYMDFTQERYSGFQYRNVVMIRHLVSQALRENLFQMCYKYENVVFTHAGVTKTWAKTNDIDLGNLEKSINERFIYKPRSFEFNGSNPYGNDVTQSPIWVRPSSLVKDRIEGFTFVVGHTAVDEMVMKEDVVIIDTMRTSKEYLVYENIFGQSRFEFKKL